MSHPASWIDLYQLTSLVPHHAAGRSDHRVTMCFFSRRLPKNAHTGEPARGYLLWAGLSRCLDHLERARFDESDMAALLAHPVLGPGLTQHPDLIDRLRDWRFQGEVLAPLEGTPLFAGRATLADGTPLEVDGVAPAAYCPYLRVETDLLTAKLIETPLLSIINHMTMVASKASRVVKAAQDAGPDRAVLEFGSRRTHPAAAVDAALAAHIGGCSATSNVRANAIHGVPMAGTMDHFAIQSWERPGAPRYQTEYEYFRAFYQSYPNQSILLIDTYDTFGAKTGIRNAVRATDGGPVGIRLDSAITAANVHKARALLDELGAQHTKIYVSGGMDEHTIAALGDAPVDGYGIGERIVTSPDAPVGVGAVGKVCMVQERPSMKLSRGSGKATLPGRIQVWRSERGDLVGLDGEDHPGTPLLQPVWSAAQGRLPAPALSEVRTHALASLAALTDEARTPRQMNLPVSDALAQLIRSLILEAVD